MGDGHKLQGIPGPDAMDPRALRTALSRFATGVTVITARAPDGDLVGLTANSFSALSLDPALVLWSLRLASAQLAAFAHASHFAVNVLTAAQRPLGDHFARPAPDRFAGLDWQEGRGGAPVFADVLASFECRTMRTLELGDHLLFIGEVERFAYVDGEPLIYGCGRYAVPAALEPVSAELTQAAPARTPARPPIKDHPVGGRAGVRAGAAAAQLHNTLTPA